MYANANIGILKNEKFGSALVLIESSISEGL
jgi:hypothetical protein